MAAVAHSLRKVAQGLLLGLAAAAVGAALWASGALDGFEAKTWDIREQLMSRTRAASDQIALIFIDQASLDWVLKVNDLTWPWPRTVYAAIANFCARAGAKALVFDMLYTDPSREGVFDDEEFGKAIAANGRVVTAVFLANADATDKAWPVNLPDPGVSISGIEKWMAKERAKEVLFPLASFTIPEIGREARMLGNSNIAEDRDGVYRRSGLFAVFDGHVVPSLALAAYLAGNPGQHDLHITSGIFRVDGRLIPIDSNGRAVLRFRGGTQTHKAYGAASVIQSELQLQEGKAPNVEPSVFKDKYVFVGGTAPGLYDLRPSPMGGSYPGVEVHATALDNLLSRDFERAAPVWATLVILVVLCVGAGIAASMVSGAAGSALVYVLFIPVAPALGFAAYALGYWLQMVALELGAVLSLVGGSLATYATEGKQKRFLKNAFRQYLSPVVIEELIQSPDRLKLGGEKRELSIYFSDLQGFSTISQDLTPDALTSLLNEYLTPMTDIIMEEGGYIDKYEGDAIMAFWNAPVSQEDHGARALRAALRCQSALDEMRPGLQARLGKPFHMRIGLNSGPANVGNMGSTKRFNYTAMGDSVNLASRLEGVNKQFGTYTCASADTMALAGGEFASRELARVTVVGRSEPVTIHEPMTNAAYKARQAVLEEFGRGLALFYEGKLTDARRVFSSLAAKDPPSTAYETKCVELLSSPPKGQWTGVWAMTSK
jgi:adenylate cyclase